jgi:hypothetical protein
MSLIALACALACQSSSDEVGRLKELRRAIREKHSESAALLRAAHEELDRGNYEAAVEKHRKARALQSERDALVKSESEGIEKAARALLKDLDSDVVETRDRASKNLVALGPAAVPVLETLVPGSSAEVRYRLADAIALLKRMEIDAEGRLHQWAASARASSEYTNGDWSAQQATGKPDTLAAGDSRTAWASLTEDGGEEWLELGYEHAVRPSQVRIHETFNPGAVVRIEAIDAAGKWQILWEGKDRTKEDIRWFSIDVAPRFSTRSIRIRLDSAGVPGWNEIDAVELIGDPYP